MKQILLITLCIVSLSCSNRAEDQLKHLNGYWEIKEATVNGETKTYTFSEYVDYINVNDSLIGIKKKVKPTLKETYIATNTEEKIKVTIENNTLYLNYKTPYLTRKETVLELGKDVLKIKNEEDAIYLYKRYEPIKL
tara:strand:+ start:2239 stop:2649 length:411 start_codon:yes stop_codon:yes gene_type:complete